MLHQIKFRGKSVEQLVGDDQYLEGFGVYECEMADSSSDWFLYTEHNGVCAVHPETLGQFVGKQDKHRRDIYSGMDLRFWTGPEEWPNGYTTGKVVFNPHICTYQIHDKATNVLFDIDDWDIEIINNGEISN